MMRDVPQRRAMDRPYRARLAVIAGVIVGVAIGKLLTAAITERVAEPRVTVRDVEAVPAPRELPVSVERFHDATEGVTCWRVLGTGGISCLPDQWLTSAQAQEGE